MVVDVATGRLEDEDILIADRLCDLDVDLPIRELRDGARSKLDAKPRWIVKSQSVDWFRAAQAKLQLTARPQPRRAPYGCCLSTSSEVRIKTIYEGKRHTSEEFHGVSVQHQESGESKGDRGAETETMAGCPEKVGNFIIIIYLFRANKGLRI